MIPISISHESKIPIYVQIADHFKGMIHSGRLGNGDALPGRQALAKQVGVNINTINHGYRILEHEGYIVSRRGIGSFVNFKVDLKDREGLIEKIHEKLLNIRAHALTAGLSLSEFNSLLEKVLWHEADHTAPRGVFVECHAAWSKDIAEKIQREIGTDVRAVIFPDDKTNMKEVIKAVELSDFVITTHAHFDEVREITGSEKVIFPVDLHLSYDVMTSLAKLKEGKIAVPFLNPVTAKRLGHSIKAMGFQIDLVSVKHKDSKDLVSKVQPYGNVMVPLTHLEAVKKVMPEGINIIPIRSVLGEEALKQLKNRLSNIYPDFEPRSQ